MSQKVPARLDNPVLEDREHQLKSFLIDALDTTTASRHDAILMIARSPESLALRIIAGLSADLAKRGIGANIILATASQNADAEPAAIDLASAFPHEVRLATDSRLLGAHEQIVVGDRAVWFGDSMRREPDKRDAFSSYSKDTGQATMARQTFARVWANAAPHRISRPEVQPNLPDPAAISEQADGQVGTLTVWHPSTRH